MADTLDKKLFLLDAYALIYRSYYAFIRNPRINSKGFNTSAIFGFLLTLDDILQKQNPSHIAVVFDAPGPTFRHEMYKEYKANRDATPEDIKLSVPYIKKILEAYRIPVYESLGYEADDIIGTMAKLADSKGYMTYMMTPDKDFAQLVTQRVSMYKPARGGGDAQIWGPEEVCREFMIDDPVKVIDVLALMGDAADNIPGAPGIGPKTAKKLISKYGSVEKLLESTAELQGKQKEVLESHREKIMFSKKLVTIDTEVPLEFIESELFRKEADETKLFSVFNELEFRSFITKLNIKAQPPITEKAAVKQATQSIQGSLFGDSELIDITVSDFENLKSVEHEYIMLEEKQGLVDLVKKLMALDEFCFDTETSSIDALRSELVAIAFSWQKNKGFMVYFTDEDDLREKLKLLRPVFENPEIMKIGQNLKYDIQVLANYGIDVKGRLFDTMIAHYLLEPDMRHNLNFLAETYLKYQPVAIETLIGEKGKGQRTMRSVSPEKLREYAVEDADITWQLKEILVDLLDKAELMKLSEEIEMPLIPVLTEMERKGVTLKESSLTEYAEVLRSQILLLEKEIFKLAGIEFNISSPKQLGSILFTRLKLDDRAKKTKTSQFATGEEVLQRLSARHPIIDKVLDYRGLKKLLSTYVEALPVLINEKTGRIHTSYNQAVAATGRLSSNNPNLQNIPIRSANGREIRKAFVPAPGKIFFSADYSQIELRLMAHLSGDKGMRDDFIGGQDIHTATAAKIFGVKIEDVSREMRSKAKTANFGIIYGISAYGLSQSLNINRTEAKELIEGYFKSYPGVKEYMNRNIEQGRQLGYVKTLFGRKRYLRNIQSRNSLLRSNAERNAINAPVQGTAADIIKIAMIRIHKRLKEEEMNASMLLQVHDELIFEVAEENGDRLKDLVVWEMEHACKLDVPLIVDCGFGNNWLEAH